MLSLIIFEILREKLLVFRGHTEKYLGVKRMKEKKRAKMVTISPCSHLGFWVKDIRNSLYSYGNFSAILKQPRFFFFLVRKDFIYENLEQYKTQKLHSGATTSNF